MQKSTPVRVIGLSREMSLTIGSKVKHQHCCGVMANVSMTTHGVVATADTPKLGLENLCCRKSHQSWGDARY